MCLGRTVGAHPSVLKCKGRLEREEKKKKKEALVVGAYWIKEFIFQLGNGRDSFLTLPFHREIIYGTKAIFHHVDKTKQNPEQ